MNMKLIPNHSRILMFHRSILIITLSFITGLLFCDKAYSQSDYLWGSSVIGGVAIDADGVLSTASQSILAERREVLIQRMQPISSDLNEQVPLRKISLKKLNEEIERCAEQNEELPDAVRYLGGLTSIRYVLANPKEKDILLVGPAEGWKFDQAGCLIGKISGKPIIQLEDLITFMRAWNRPQVEPITCSIDPTPEARMRVAQLKREFQFSKEKADEYRRSLEIAFGMNDVVINGVPKDSRVARVMAAADYKLKQIGLGDENAPKGFSSYVSMVSGKSTTSSINPRFWLAPNYGTISHDAERLTWDLSQSGVKVLTESQYIDENGARTSLKSDPSAQRWAEKMTKEYKKLCSTDSVFADLQNCMELAVAVALIRKENMLAKTGCNATSLLERNAILLPKYAVPTQVQSIGAIHKKSGGVVVGCGGVEINPWKKLDSTVLNEELNRTRNSLTAMKGDQFWSN